MVHESGPRPLDPQPLPFAPARRRGGAACEPRLSGLSGPSPARCPHWLTLFLRTPPQVPRLAFISPPCRSRFLCIARTPAIPSPADASGYRLQHSRRRPYRLWAGSRETSPLHPASSFAGSVRYTINNSGRFLLHRSSARGLLFLHQTCAVRMSTAFSPAGHYMCRITRHRNGRGTMLHLQLHQETIATKLPVATGAPNTLPPATPLLPTMLFAHPNRCTRAIIIGRRCALLRSRIGHYVEWRHTNRNDRTRHPLLNGAGVRGMPPPLLAQLKATSEAPTETVVATKSPSTACHHRPDQRRRNSTLQRQQHHTCQH